MLLKIYYHYNFILLDTKFDNKGKVASILRIPWIKNFTTMMKFRLRELVVSWILRHHEYHDFHEIGYVPALNHVPLFGRNMES